MKKDPGERKNLAKDPKYSKILAEHRALLDDYITRSKDDYRSLKVDADPGAEIILPATPATKVLGHGRSSKENNSIKKSEDCLPVFALFISFAHHHTSKQNSE